MPNAPLEARTHRGRQTTQHYAVYERKGHKVRVRIRQDRFYVGQSSAVAEVWSPVLLQWNEAATLHWSEWAEDTSPLDDGTNGLWEAESRLLAEVDALL